jgi:hypothetical protein
MRRPQTQLKLWGFGIEQSREPFADNNGTITIGSLTFEHTGSWSADRLAALNKALALIPQDALKIVDGMKFRIDAGTSPNGEDGHYEEEKRTVVIFSSAFRANDLKRTGESRWAVYAITHEIGHAIDLANLGKAWADYQSSGKESKLKDAVSPSGSKWEKDGGGVGQMEERINNKDGEFRKAAIKDGSDVTTRQSPPPIPGLLRR